MVNRKRAPWWNREANSTALGSKKPKSYVGQRLPNNVNGSTETSSVLSNTAEEEYSNRKTELASNIDPYKSSDIDNNQNSLVCNDAPVVSINYNHTLVGNTVYASPRSLNSGDVTPTKDEEPVWKIIDNTNDEIEGPIEHEDFGELIVTSQSGDLPENTCSNSSLPKHSSSSAIESANTDNAAANANATVATNDMSSICVETGVQSSTSETLVSPISKIESGVKKRLGSVDSARSSITMSSGQSSVSSSSSKHKKSHHNGRHSTKSSHESDRRKSRSKSRDDDHKQEPPRKLRKLTVAYDELRAKNGTALPARTYDPLNPWDKYSAFGRRGDSTKHLSRKYYVSKFARHGESSDSFTTRNRSSSSLEKSSSKKEMFDSSHSQDTYSNPALKEDDVKIKVFFENSTRSVKPDTTSESHSSANKVFSSSDTSRYSRAKSIFSAHKRKSVVIKKQEAKAEGIPRMMTDGDGIGILKVKQNQRKMLLNTCVKEYYMEPDGSLAKGVKPLLAFKVANPQFVSEFYEKKTEIQNRPVSDSEMVYKLMKERFVFKVKLGLDRLEQFVTDGITVNGQRAFFSQHRHMDTVYKNAVLLYRYADACLGWTKLKYFPKSTPIVLLVHKVVYGRTRTFPHITDTNYIKRTHNCDCLKQNRFNIELHGDDKLRISLNASKVIIADFADDGSFRERPRQILPYAFIVYCNEKITKEEEIKMKQDVLEWKRQFELQRFKLLANSEMLRRQALQCQQAVQRPNLVPGYTETHEPIAKVSKSKAGSKDSPLRRVNTNSIEEFLSSLRSRAVQQIDSSLPEPTAVRTDKPIAMRDEKPTAVTPDKSASLTPTDVAPDKPTVVAPDVPQVKPVQARLAYRDSSSPHSVSIPETSAKSKSSKCSVTTSTNAEKQRVGEPEELVSSTQHQSYADASTATPTLETKDAGVQVKTQSTIISLQKRNVSLSASTQTPDLDKDDGYEACLLRGGPLPPAPPAQTTHCSRCNREMSTTGSEGHGDRVVAKLFKSSKDKFQKQYPSLSDRFLEVNNEKDIFIDEDEIAALNQ